MLNGISIADGNGKDAMFNVLYEGMDARKKFFTDSNGLEMQERIYNYRPTWDFTKSISSITQNISANYYPVVSAIRMQDVNNNNQFTVMTDKSTAGSADLTPGQIELIINRRLIYDDDRGVGEPLNEQDKFGKGMKVNSKYWLEFVGMPGASKQRATQLRVDQPLQLFFGFKKSDGAPRVPPKETQEWIPLAAPGLEEAKMVFMPIGFNEVMVRLENLHDNIDGKQTTVPRVDIMSVALKLWYEANPGSKVMPEVYINELALGGNQDIKAA